jgi:glycosyltransferase involved in cell wall biosynthesis
VSPHSLKFIRKKYHLEPYFIPVSTNVDFFISPKNIKRKKIILCVGRMVKQKNFELLIEVFREVVFLDKRADFNLMFVGEGDTKTELEKKVKKYNLSKKVLFLGNKNHDEVKKIMQTSMIFVLPSLHEGWGLVAIEAMAAGLPIVMTKTGCADYAVINKKNGFIVPINDKKALRKAILNLIDNPKLIRKISSYNINKTKKIDTEKSFRMWIECLEETAKIKVEKR